MLTYMAIVLSRWKFWVTCWKFHYRNCDSVGFLCFIAKFFFLFLYWVACDQGQTQSDTIKKKASVKENFFYSRLIYRWPKAIEYNPPSGL